MMIHNPSGLVVGTSKDMRDLAAALDKMRDSLAGIYAGKSGQTREKIAGMMEDVTWLSAAGGTRLPFLTPTGSPAWTSGHHC